MKSQLICGSFDINSEDMFDWSKIVNFLEFVDQSLFDPTTFVFTVRDDSQIIDINKYDNKLISITMDEDTGILVALLKILFFEECDKSYKPLTACLFEPI